MKSRLNIDCILCLQHLINLTQFPCNYHPSEQEKRKHCFGFVHIINHIQPFLLATNKTEYGKSAQIYVLSEMMKYI